MVDNLSAAHIEQADNQCTLTETGFPHEILRRLVLKCLHICDPALSPRGPQLERLIIALQKGKTVTIGDTLCNGGQAWHFKPAPKRRN